MFEKPCARVCAQSCETSQPHGLQSIRLPCPWDSPGKNTGVGLLFPSSGQSSQLRDQTCVSCIGFFTTAPAGKPLRNSGLCKHQQTYLCESFRAYIENNSIKAVLSKIYFTLEYLSFFPMEHVLGALLNKKHSGITLNKEIILFSFRFPPCLT